MKDGDDVSQDLLSFPSPLLLIKERRMDIGLMIRVSQVSKSFPSSVKLFVCVSVPWVRPPSPNLSDGQIEMNGASKIKTTPQTTATATVATATRRIEA